ncbi:MAG: hypothetical protein K0R36_174 [Chryseobacterium sp.]|jgi:hypothetical protein|nr:hypothetical protein [Chryseobacterium sp.]
MNVKDLLKEMESQIVDIQNTDFEYLTSSIIPNRNDPGLTFGRGEIKKGKLIKTCVLYVDIRNSVKMTELHHNKTMAKLYTVFTNGVIRAAKEFNGHIRNIIGDRVMIVFEPQNCFTNAIDCAITINHLSQIINRKFTLVDFKCGIGIDYGDMRVLKVGIHVKGTNGIENKGLVWTGKPANYASRLTDFANKEIVETKFEIKYKSYLRKYLFPRKGLGGVMGAVELDDDIFIKTVTSEEFIDSIQNSENGKLKTMVFGDVISYKKIEEKKVLPPILISLNVFSELKKIIPKRQDITENFWKEQSIKIKDLTVKVFGADTTWNLN